jgi:hypothetical protein
MYIQFVSSQKEDPLSTSPVFWLATWLGILVIISGVTGGTIWHTSYVPNGVSRGVVALGQSLEEETEGEIVLGESVFHVASAEEIKKEEGKKQLEKDVRTLVAGYPIEVMAPFIAKQDRSVAAFLVGIAKKESDWGRRVPTQNGRECYNYWGYKGAGSLGHGMGYGCFASPEEAITIVGGRIHTLVVEKENKTPRDMVIWKCGSRSCTGHAPGSAEKWISDVNVYYSKLVAFAG